MRTEEIRIAIDGGELVGTLTFPVHALGLVIFVHGGSSTYSVCDQSVAELMQSRGLATLRFDLATDAVEALAEQLLAATDHVVASGRAQALPIAYFGGSTGAAAALIAAARRPQQIAAVVSCGGRADLAGATLRDVVAPTMLVVGGDDVNGLALDRQAATQLRCEHRIEIIAGATHLFEEPGALDRVARVATTWLVWHFATTQLTRAAAMVRVA